MGEYQKNQDFLSEDYQANIEYLDQLLGVGRSCDMIARDYIIGGHRTRLWVVDGYGRDDTLERMGAFWLSLPGEELVYLKNMRDFTDRFVSFTEVSISDNIENIMIAVLSGKSLLLMDGLSGVWTSRRTAKFYAVRMTVL